MADDERRTPQPSRSTGETPPEAPRPRSGGRNLALLVLVLMLGAGGGALAVVLLGGDGQPVEPGPTGPGAATPTADPDARAELPEPGPLLDPSEATEPRTAVEGFLTAEARGEFATSYEFLTRTEREDVFGTQAAWVNAHGEFPPISAFSIQDVAREDGTARVTTLTGFRSSLDPVLGLIPARARTTWRVTEEDGLWRVASQDAANQPLYLGDDGASAAAESWVAARGACEDTTEWEARQVLGSPGLADPLCADGQAPSLGPVGTLTDTDDATTLLSAWGPQVFAWARTVPVEAAQPFQLVLGPIGFDWKVVAVIPRVGR